MPADKTDFEIAQEIHELLCDVADQGSKEDALNCSAMDRLMGCASAIKYNRPDPLPEFLFRCAIAVQFGPVQSVASEGEKGGQPPTWGEDSLTQRDKDTAQRITDMTNAYLAHHDEGPIELAPEDKDDKNQGMT